LSFGEGGAAQAQPLEIQRFRPIHYLGSKLRALEPILEAMDRLDPTRGPVCDLFAGSGTVAYAASHRRKVVAVDIQRYSATICSALLGPPTSRSGPELEMLVLEGEELAALANAAAPLIDLERGALAAASAGDLRPMAEILEEGALIRLGYGHIASSPALRAAQAEAASRLQRQTLGAVCLRHFGGVFFSYRQALLIDATLSVIRRHALDQGPLTAALLTAMSRTVNTVGKQFAQPLRLRAKSGQLKRHLRAKILADRALDPLAVTAAAVDEYRSLLRTRDDHEVICDDYQAALRRLRGRVSLVFADPPYTRDHYSRYYHVLETMAVGDDPAIAMSNLGGGKLLSRGHYRADRHQSDFCIRSKAPDAFRALFAGTRELGVPLLLSYSDFDAGENAHPRVLGIKDVKALAEQFFPNVSVQALALFAYSKLNHARLHKGADGTKEILISCR
jgi:adenine-specific DNA-methyltransferase